MISMYIYIYIYIHIYIYIYTFMCFCCISINTIIHIAFHKRMQISYMRVKASANHINNVLQQPY